MIRQASFDDRKELLRMGKSFCKLLGYPSKNKDLLSLFEGAITGWKQTVIVSARQENSGPLNGMLMAGLTPWMGDNSILFAIEHAWWVDPEARKGKIGKELIERYIEWAKASGASKICMSSFTRHKGEIIGRFYKTMGFELLENCYVLEL